MPKDYNIKWNFELTNEEFDMCEKFADNSSKSQRENRSGGTEKRDIPKIKGDTLRGKVGEVILKNFLEQEPFNFKDITLDFEVYPRGVWDKTDIKINGKNISIKSSKWYSKWLLLESKDILRGEVSDYYVLVLIERDMKKGDVKGFAWKEEIINENEKTLLLKKGELIPNTNTSLDADNHSRCMENLHNSIWDWIKLATELRG